MGDSEILIEKDIVFTIPSSKLIDAEDKRDIDEIDKFEFGGKSIAWLTSHGNRMRGVISDE